MNKISLCTIFTSLSLWLSYIETIKAKEPDMQQQTEQLNVQPSVELEATDVLKKLEEKEAKAEFEIKKEACPLKAQEEEEEEEEYDEDEFDDDYDDEDFDDDYDDEDWDEDEDIDD